MNKAVYVLLAFACGSVSAGELTAEEIRNLRHSAEAQKEAEKLAELSDEKRAARQIVIDAEVTMAYKSRLQMRPSIRNNIAPECNEWLELYRETGWKRAKDGIASTCPKYSR